MGFNFINHVSSEDISQVLNILDVFWNILE